MPSQGQNHYAAQGFLAAYNSMQQLIGKLVDAGVLKKNEQSRQ